MWKFRKYKKHCDLTNRGSILVDYKNVDLLQKYLNYNNRIVPRRISGLSMKMQRRVANAIKRARFVGLLPFVKE